jgi:malonyl-CoA O-methyltransferase
LAETGPTLPDKHAVRRAFSRAAPHYDEHAFVQREVGARLVEHLEGIRITPQRILDLGCGTGAGFAPLAQRFPQSRIVGLDVALPMLREARARTPWWRRVLPGNHAPALACADAEALPFAAGRFDFVFSNLTLQWLQPQRAFEEAARVLATGGLLLFSTLGPDTLKELREAFAQADGAGSHVHPFVDMHDLGDALVHAGFADPVMEMEVLTLEYDDLDAVVRDVRAIGAANALPGRPRALGGRERWKRVREAYERHRRDGILPATYEVVYGHAWKVAPRTTDDGRAIMQFHPRKPA